MRIDVHFTDRVGIAQEILAQLATARSQLQAQATLAQGQAGSSGNGEYADPLAGAAQG